VSLTGLERSFRFSTQATLLRFPCARLRAFARRFRLGASKVEFDGWQEKSKLCSPPRVSKTTLAQLREATHAIYSCRILAAVGSREGSADPRQVEPCVGPDISTPPQRRGGEGVAGDICRAPVRTRAGRTLTRAGRTQTRAGRTLARAGRTLNESWPYTADF
jgi:hypothetical protein